MKSVNRKKKSMSKVSKKYFTGLLISFLALIMIVILLSSSVIYGNYEKKTINENGSISQQMLSETVNNTELIWDWASMHAFELYGNDYIFNALYSHNITAIDELNAQKIMSYAINANPYIYSIYLYNGYTNEFYSSLSNRYSSEEFYDQDIIAMINDTSAKTRFRAIPRKIYYKHYDKIYEEDVISFIITELLGEEEPVNGALIFNFKVSTLEDSLTYSKTVGNDFFTIVSDGRILIDSRPDNFLDDISEESYIQQIGGLSEASGYFTGNIDGEKYQITYIESEELGWVFIKANLYLSLFEQTKGLRNLIIILSLLIYFFSAVFTFLLVRRFYNPIGALFRKVKNDVDNFYASSVPQNVNEIEYISRTYQEMTEDFKLLQQQNRNNKVFLKRELIKNIVNGRYLEYENIGERFKKLEIALEPHGFSLVLFRIDGYWNGLGAGWSIESINEQKINLESIIRNELLQVCICETVDLGEDKLLAVTNPPEAAGSGIVGLKKPVIHIQKEANESLGISMSVSISEPIKEAAELYGAYKYLCKISDYRLLYGEGCVITSDMTAKNIGAQYSYPEKLEKEILDSIRLHRLDKAEEKTATFFEEIKSLSVDGILMSVSRLVYTSLKTIAEIEKTNNNVLDFKEFQAELEHTDTLTQMQERVCDIFRGFIEKKSNGCVSARLEHAQDTKKIIEKEYGDCNLSPEWLSLRLNLSVNYLREVFKECTGISLSNYITVFRCEKAKAMLIDTNMRVSEISHKIGLENQNYFYTLFKKHTGFTPALYRKAHKKLKFK